MKYILNLVGFSCVDDFLGTYHSLFSTIFAFSLTFGTVTGIVETYSGISFMLWVFMLGGTVTDLVIGVIANVKFQNQEFETSKFMRGVFKAFVLFAIIFVTHSFKMGIVDSKIEPEILKTPFIYLVATIHYSFIMLIGLYILLSIVENLAKMNFEVAVSLTKILKVKIKKIENLNEDENNTENP